MRGITLAQIEQTIHTRLDFSAHRQSFVQSATD
jgi:hypothetical protein